MKIYLYKCKANTKTVDKYKEIDFIKELEEYSILADTDITNMSILIPFDDTKQDIEILQNANYCYVKKTNRYYFIQEKVMKTGQLLELQLEEDYLMSWKSKILSSNQIIARNEFDYDGRIPDNNYPVFQEKMVSTKIIGGSPFNINNMTNSSNCIVMTVTGGGI